jgi:hypothetical protein
MSEVLIPEPPHRHDLPHPYSVPDFTLARCGTCGKWLWRGEQYYGFGSDKVWYRVLWFNFGMRRRIKAGTR